MLQVPKNVMQIGEINSHTKIYMEDYVHTFLERRKGTETYLAFGKKEDIGDDSYYMIYGVEKKTDWDRGSLPYFKKYERIGTIEGPAGRWTLKPVRGSGISIDGYFVFYEQNDDMQTYMIAVREKEAIAGSEEKEAVMEAVRSHRDQRRKELREMSEGPVYRRDADGTGVEPPGEGRREGTLEKAAYEDIRTGKVLPREKSQGAARLGKLKAFRKSGGKGFAAAERRSVPKRTASAGRRKMHTEKKRSYTIADLCRAGSLALLLVLVATGLTSLNRYPDMKAVTELFSNAAKAVGMGKDRAVTTGAEPQDGSLIVEEATAGQEESAEAAEAAQDIPDGEDNLAPAQEGGQIQWTIGQNQEASNTGDGARQAEKTEEPELAGAEEPTGQISEEPAPKTDGQAQETENGMPETADTQEATQAIARPVTYVVKKGDSLAAIARKFYGTSSRVKEICSVNGIKDPDQIRPGQNILLP